MRVVPVKFKRVVMSAYHLSPLSGYSHEHITLFRIIVCSLWSICNKVVDQFIISCAHFPFLNACSNEVQNKIHAIESDTPFDVVF